MSERPSIITAQWRIAGGGWKLDTDPSWEVRIFHAYDENDHALCEPMIGLGRTVEQPNESSSFCPACMELAGKFVGLEAPGADMSVTTGTFSLVGVDDGGVPVAGFVADLTADSDEVDG